MPKSSSKLRFRVKLLVTDVNIRKGSMTFPNFANGKSIDSSVDQVSSHLLVQTPYGMTSVILPSHALPNHARGRTGGSTPARNTSTRTQPGV